MVVITCLSRIHAIFRNNTLTALDVMRTKVVAVDADTDLNTLSEICAVSRKATYPIVNNSRSVLASPYFALSLSLIDVNEFR